MKLTAITQVVLAVTGFSGGLLAQSPASPEPSSEGTDPARTWEFSFSGSQYVVPEDQDYFQPTFTADRGWLHLEARYNYEDLETGSAWVGYNFSWGDTVTLDLTPMVGGVFGETAGIAPGYEVELSWWKLSLSIEGEYVFDQRNHDGSFYYSWTELSLSPWTWARFGLVAQRTKAYQSELDIQRGFLVGFTWRRYDFTAYVFDWGWSDPTLVFALGASF